MRSRGNLSVEFAFGIIIVAIVGIGVVDLSALLLAEQFNDALCTEASEMAASGPPDQVTQRANLVVARAKNVKNWFISGISMVKKAPVTLTGPSPTILKTTGGAVDGIVCVCTEVQVRLPVFGGALRIANPTLQTTRTSQFRYSYPVP